MGNVNNDYFKKYCNFIYEKTGIFISNKKRDLFNIKLNKAMKKANINSYEEYFEYLQRNDNKELLQYFLNTITTNTTQFFRENHHFEYIVENMHSILNNNPRIQINKEIRIWSAGCSSGEEPITLAIVLKEYFCYDINIKILATDINTDVLLKAIKGIYSLSECENIPKIFINKYFDKINDDFSVKEEIKNLITYRSLNLKEDFKFKKGFDMIFCRNVMIYFDRDVQENLINKYYNQLVNGGLFFIGHSESLINKKHNYRYVKPSIYMK